MRRDDFLNMDVNEKYDLLLQYYPDSEEALNFATKYYGERGIDAFLDRKEAYDREQRLESVGLISEDDDEDEDDRYDYSDEE